MAFSDEFLSELRDRNDIEDVISTYVNLKRQGKILKRTLPFPQRKNAVVHRLPRYKVFLLLRLRCGR